VSQKSKPRVYTFDEICESQDLNHEHEFVDKQAFDRVVEALKFYADKSNHTVRRGGESDTRVRLDKGSSAREALKEVGEL
jgi:hypothetical protein